MSIAIVLCLLQQSDFEKDLDALIPRLQDERIEARDKVKNELFKLVDAVGAKARAPLRTRIVSATDPEVKAVLTAAIGRIPILELKLQVVGEPKVGQSLAVKVLIRNVSDEEVSVVRIVDGSDCGLRFPKFSALLLGPDSRQPPSDILGRLCGNCALFKQEHVVLLKPNEETDISTPGKMDQITHCKPVLPGKHSLAVTVDYSAKEASEWTGRVERPLVDHDAVGRWLAKVPRIKIEAKLEFEVKK